MSIAYVHFFFPSRDPGRNTTCMMTNCPAKITLRILLIGKTGHGKSSTGNLIVGRKAFRTSSQSKSVTKAVEDAWAVHGGYEIQVIDGPGLEDTDLDAAENKEQACENMATALMKCNGGVHAFVLVIKFSTRFTREERQSISDLKQIFGDECLKDHGIIVFTGGDRFPDQMEADGTKGKTFKQWYQEQDDLHNLIQECGSRVVLFNNMTKSEEEKIRQRNELIVHAETIQKEGGLYTSECFQQYAQARAKFIKDSKLKILEDTIQKRIDLLSAELGQLSIGSSLNDVDLLDARIRDVYTEIGSENQQEESMQQLLASLKRLSTTTRELRRAIKEKNMNNIQEQLAALSQEKQNLNQARGRPWDSIFAGIGAGLAVGGVILAGAAIFAAAGGSIASLAPVGRALTPMCKTLLGFVGNYLKYKIQQ